MYGSKMPQLKDAMNKILPDLKEDDLFSLVEFSSSVKVWDINDHNKSVQYPEESIVWNYDSLHSSYDVCLNNNSTSIFHIFNFGISFSRI